ncbi:MAG: His/Gly/Thr/Pro-type tRNA ligase C-terminal domain-containing protein [Chitinophagales bacterium]
MLPISDKFMEYANEVQKLLKENGFRTKVDDRAEKIGKKIRDAALKKIPYSIIIGEKEVENNTISIRKHGEGDIGSETVKDFIDLLQKLKDTYFRTKILNLISKEEKTIEDLLSKRKENTELAQTSEYLKLE